MFAIVKQYWKLILALLYAIAIPLYFHQSNKGAALSLDLATNSANIQIEELQDSMIEQKQFYDDLIINYQEEFDRIEEKYQIQQKELQEVKRKQKSAFVRRWKKNPSSINEELQKRFSIKYVNNK